MHVKDAIGTERNVTL